MARGLSYRDAAVLLGGGPETTVVAALDKLFGGALLTASVFSPALALSLFDAKAELFKISNELIGGLGDRVRGLSRYDRTRRLEAANAVAEMAAFFDCLSEIGLPRELRPTKAEQVAVALESGHASFQGLILDKAPPVPMPSMHSEQHTADLRAHYLSLTLSLQAFLEGLASWDVLAGGQRAAILDRLRVVPDRAAARYAEMFRRLALEFPEFGYWANQLDHRATRAHVDVALAGLAVSLERLRIGRDPAGTRLDLARRYQAVLRRPGRTFGDLREPAIDRCYVNPNFRVGQPRLDQITSTDWWDDQPLRTDFQDFLVGHLTSPMAAEAPLVVLGHPGAGKSLLTQMLPARLPASDFLTVRVPLRDVPTDADLQTQIEVAIRNDTGADTTWSELVATAGDALPVVLLDGFDELLQATGQSHSNYLERIAAFQQREADLGHPLAVVVTSRLTVADRTRPVSGMVTLLLESFDDRQIERWLTAWNECNAATLAARRVRPLPPTTALRYEELARQPLLLLLLAIYDSDANALHHAERLHEADLYERLLTNFTRREVLKSDESLSDGELEQLVAQEMLHLSVVAFAMFNRNQQWVSEAELDNDLRAMVDQPARAELLVGRFYFVYVAQATDDQKLLRTYEFLHATFGEFLVARLVVQELDNLVAAAAVPSTPGRPREIDDRFLHAVLSFAPLTMRLTVVEFVSTMLAGRPDIAQVTDLLLGLFRTALQHRSLPALNYQPARLSAPARAATYSANLFLLAALTAGQLTSAQLFPDREDHAIEWTRTAQLWRSQLPSEGWTTLVSAFSAVREWDDEVRVVRLVVGDTAPAGHPIGADWTYNVRPTEWDSTIFMQHDNDWVMRAEVEFTGGRLQEVGLHNLEPFTGELGDLLMAFHAVPGKGLISAARALTTLWLASGQRVDPMELSDEYRACLWIATYGFGPDDEQTRRAFRDIVLHQLRYDLPRLGSGWIPTAVDELESSGVSWYTAALEFLAELRQLRHGD
ncbi:ATP-binding protein [Kutzneria sp. NPDC051319]|uniref:NACHT domain-containing protein n=1 Tax=Kutzneria sp. NPDC051319 TaxID=3155047 RepID=UPI003420701E